MKNLLIIISILTGLIFILWIFVVFPYPPCTIKQIEVTKQELIDGILEREIKLRELYSNVNGKEFIQTKEFKQQLQKERKKFYKYCDNGWLFDYKNERCEININMRLSFMNRYSNYTVNYHFDDESKKFFNQITTYWGYEKFSTNPTGRGKVWHDRFWKAIEDKQLKILHPTNIVGYSTEYSFFNCANSKEHWWPGTPKLELANSKAVNKKDLVYIESKSIQYKSISLDKKGRHNYGSIGSIKTYIQR